MGKEGASGGSRFVLPLPDRNRHVPVRNIPFPIFRNTGFVFPSGLSVPVSVPDKKIQEREWLRHFSDRFHPYMRPIWLSMARVVCVDKYRLIGFNQRDPKCATLIDSFNSYDLT